MAYSAKKTEHAGAKKGSGAFYGPKKIAKRGSNRKRRRDAKREVADGTPSESIGDRVRRQSGLTESQSAWEQACAYGRRKARELGIRSERDIERAIEEYRRGDISPCVASNKRRPNAST